MAKMTKIFVSLILALELFANLINGRNAFKSEANFIVQVRAKINKHSHLCTGSLLNACTVLTAAQCIFSEKKLKTENVTIRYETKKSNYIDYDDIKPESIHVHPGYKGGENNIAIIKISEPVQNRSHVNFVPFDQKGLINGNENITIYGWGCTSAGGVFIANQLKKFEEKTLTQKDCRKLGIKQSEICTHSEIGNACENDSFNSFRFPGGPMIFNGLLVGVESRVQTSCRPCGFKYYTRVSSYVSFIKKYMSKNKNCEMNIFQKLKRNMLKLFS